MINKDYHSKHFPRLPRHTEGITSTFLAVCAVFTVFSVMGWSVITSPEPAPPKLMNAEELRLHTELAMSRYSANVVKEMERRVDEGRPYGKGAKK